MLQHKAYKFRIYPTEEQQVQISKTIGCSRFVFNHFLDKWNTAYNETGKGLTYGTCYDELTKLKKELNWLKEPDKFSLQNSLKNLADSYSRFFKKQNDAPRFKSKKNPVQSYQTNFTNGNIVVSDKHIKLPKLGLVRYAKSREVEGRIISATVRRNPSGKYFVSVLAEAKVQPLLKTGIGVGIDLGLKDFAILSTGVPPYKNPKFLQSMEVQLANAQRILSRRVTCSANWNKQRIKVAKLHERIVNARTDYLQKISTYIVKNHDMIAIEDLQVSAMMQDHKVAKAISEVSWYQFRTMLEYKAKWYGRTVIAVDPKYTSQTCNRCGHISKDNRKTQADFKCVSCDHEDHADVNASKNILVRAMQLQ